MNQPTNFVAYYRVSTKTQGHSGLGLEAQKRSVTEVVERRAGHILESFTEVESGTKADRVQLKAAIDYCLLFDATLVIANISRLARNAAFVLSLRDSGVKFMCADMPDANDFTVNIMALVATQQARDISLATKRGLAAAKRRGVKLGNPNPNKGPLSAEALEKSKETRERKAARHAERIRPMLISWMELGHNTQREITYMLNHHKVPMVSGKVPNPEKGHRWSGTMTTRLVERLGLEMKRDRKSKYINGR